jgi:sulfur carrier protein
MEIVVNGERRMAPEGQTILGLLRELGLEPTRVAVEYDRKIVKQALWPETVLHAGIAVGDRTVCGGRVSGVVQYYQVTPRSTPWQCFPQPV